MTWLFATFRRHFTFADQIYIGGTGAAFSGSCIPHVFLQSCLFGNDPVEIRGSDCRPHSGNDFSPTRAKVRQLILKLPGNPDIIDTELFDLLEIILDPGFQLRHPLPKVLVSDPGILF